jgi:hypothetical protein
MLHYESLTELFAKHFHGKIWTWSIRLRGAAVNLDIIIIITINFLYFLNKIQSITIP